MTEGDSMSEQPGREGQAGLTGSALKDKQISILEAANADLQRELERLDAPLPDWFSEHLLEWVRANHVDGAKVRWGHFPLGMVQRWIERAEAAEAERDALRKSRLEAEQETQHYVQRAARLLEELDTLRAKAALADELATKLNRDLLAWKPRDYFTLWLARYDALNATEES